MCLRHFIPTSFVAALVLLTGLAAFLSWAGILLFVLLCVYALAAVSASVITAARFGLGLLAYLPLVFAILHIGYGAGFLAGLVRFASRWGDREGQAPRLNPNCS